MELHKNIFCNTDKLEEGSIITICYTGSLYNGNNGGDLYIHYGFGENWDNTSEIKMLKTDFGYEANVKLIGFNSLNCCFRDGNNNWDNNGNDNYCFKIEKVISQNADIKTETTSFTSPTIEKEVSKENVSTSLQVINENWIDRLTALFKRIANYVPKIISGTWKRKKTSEN